MELFDHTLRLPKGHHTNGPVAALSDIHGRSDRFREALNAISRPKDTTLVLLGDYIDRGPDTVGCLRILQDVLEDNRFKDVIMLPGNHEGLLMTALNGRMSDLILWAKNGGAQVMDEVQNDMGVLRRMIPDEIWARLRGDLPPFHQDGSLLFVHAGLNPQVDTADFLSRPYDTPGSKGAAETSWAWVRGSCLNHAGTFTGPNGEDVFLVHGHSSCDMTHDPDEALRWVFPETHNRICLDLSRADLLPLFQADGDLVKVQTFGAKPYLGCWGF